MSLVTNLDNLKEISEQLEEAGVPYGDELTVSNLVEGTEIKVCSSSRVFIFSALGILLSDEPYQK